MDRRSRHQALQEVVQIGAVSGEIACAIFLYRGCSQRLAKALGGVVPVERHDIGGFARDLEQLGGQLHDALSSRDVIGQAKGILMERLRITPDDAFDALRRASQRLNLKLREIAHNLVETGEFADDTDRS